MTLSSFSLLLFSYLLGSLPTGVLFSRWLYSLDVRGLGSGNTGATNIARNFGIRAGVFVFLIDFAKGAVPCLLALPLGSRFMMVAGAAAVMGHCFSVFLRFRGGKGVATAAGVLAMVSPLAFACGLGGYAATLILFRIGYVASLSGLLGASLYTLLASEDVELKYLLGFLAVLIVLRHRSNLTRSKDSLSHGKR